MRLFFSENNVFGALVVLLFRERSVIINQNLFCLMLSRNSRRRSASDFTFFGQIILRQLNDLYIEMIYWLAITSITQIRSQQEKFFFWFLVYYLRSLSIIILRLFESFVNYSLIILGSDFNHSLIVRIIRY